MATKVHPVSTLNPNAPLFVPASAYRVIEDFSAEWWNLVQTCPAFREQWVQERLPVLEEQEMFEADLEEIADLDEFLEYQDELEEMEAAQASLHFDDINDGKTLEWMWLLYGSLHFSVSSFWFAVLVSGVVFVDGLCASYVLVPRIDA